MKRILSFFAITLSLFTLARGAQAVNHPPPAASTAAHDDAHPAPAASAAPAPAADEPEDKLPPKHDPVTMKVGVLATELNKFDLATGSYNAEFIVTVRCDHEPCKPDLDVANGKISGKPEKLHDEPLFKVFKVKAELAAVVDLGEYPFDNHALPIVLEDKGDPAQIKYTIDAEHTGVRPDIKLPGWDVTQFAATAAEEDDGAGEKISQVHYAIEAKRPALMAFFKSIVPIMIMLFVAAFTLLLKPKSAAGRLSAATGGLMSIVMFQVGQVGSLPPLGYLTRLDKFMIATYLIYLLNIGLTVAMVRFEEKKNERGSELMYLVAAGAVPGLALLVWTTVFSRLV